MIAAAAEEDEEGGRGGGAKDDDDDEDEKDEDGVEGVALSVPAFKAPRTSASFERFTSDDKPKF